MWGKGALITLEGIDGSGKSAIAGLLCKELSERGYPVTCSYEPRFEEYKRLIRGLGEDRESIYVETMLFAADRLLHYSRILRPALLKGHIVIVDRYYHSSLAYQGARGVPLEWIRSLNRFVPRPDMAIYLDVDPRVGLSRKEGEAWDKTRFQKLGLLERVRGIYRRLAEGGELILVDADRPLSKVYDDVLSLILGFLGRHGGRD